MSGTTLTLLERTDFSYTNLGVSAATGEIPLVQNIDISQWVEATLLVRVHAGSLGVNGQKYNVILRSVLPSSEEPNAFFRDEAAELANIEIVVADTAGAPTLLQEAVADNAGAMCSLFLVATQGSQAGSVNATLSIALSLKD